MRATGISVTARLRLRALPAIVVTALLALLSSEASASLTLSSGLGTTHAGNLVSNGSFENGVVTTAPADGVHANFFASVPDDWGPAGFPTMNPVWGNDGVTPYRLKASDVLPDGRLGVFFGTGSGTSVSPAPVFQPSGRITFGPGGPTFTYGGGEGPTGLIQTVPNLSASQTYKMSFWVSGEENSTNQGNIAAGILEFHLSNVLPSNDSVYLAVPNGTLYGQSKRYEFLFQPLTNGPVTMTFTGHGRMFYAVNTFGPAAILDDVIINAVPEPGALLLVGMALSLLSTGRFRGRGFREPAGG